MKSNDASAPSPGGKPPCLREDALEVVRRLRDSGHVAYFAGGCVRDELLGHKPKDYDVATDAPPAGVRKIFADTQAVGAAFGVILVRIGPSVVEVATFRTDDRYLDGRRPEKVHFTTAQEDAKRRDFTINGLFLDPIANRVIDHVGGQEDLKAKRLRAIGEPGHRFAEDHLRLLRAVRFAARFGLEIEPATAAAIREHAPMLVRISPERSAEELRLMLGAPTSRKRAWELLWEYALVDVIFRHLPTASKAPLTRERSVLIAISADEPLAFGEVLGAAALCYRWQRGGGSDIRSFLDHEAAITAAKAMRQALRISNEEADELRAMTELLAPLLTDQAPRLAIKKRFLASSYYPSAMELLEAIARIGEHADRIWPLYEELTMLQTTEFAPPPLLTGDDLTALGWEPGPIFKRVLDIVYDAQLEARISTRDEALEMALKLKDVG